MRNVFVVAAGELNEIEFHLAIVDDKIMSLLAFLVKFSAFLRITAHLSCVSSHSCLMFDDCRRFRRKILFVYHSPVRRFFILDTLFFLFFSDGYKIYTQYFELKLLVDKRQQTTCSDIQEVSEARTYPVDRYCQTSFTLIQHSSLLTQFHRIA